MIDLHTHSAFSDGTQTPQELLAHASASGVTTIGLTDHDTVAGWNEATDAARTNGVHLVRGMEVSCRYEGVSVHMLSYLHNPQGARLTAETEKIRAARVTRTRKIVDLLSADFPITWEHVSQHVGRVRLLVVHISLTPWSIRGLLGIVLKPSPRSCTATAPTTCPCR